MCVRGESSVGVMCVGGVRSVVVSRGSVDNI